MDHPLFWNLDNDFAPHGNDTGFDLLFEYRDWIRNDDERDPFDFYRGLMSAWELHPSKEDFGYVFDEAAIALAYAHFKFHGRCSDELKAFAVEAIGRQRDKAIVAVEWDHREDALRALEMLETKLKQMPE